ncbi:MAG: hypothetical protein RLZZ618_3204 [Pseudomonadota bacterium]|jgi:hypothetical protein
MRADLPVVKNILGVDICRDGGSYSLCFDSDDGRWYEFFLKTRAFDPVAIASHEPPAVYCKGSDDGQLVRNLSWVEGMAFVAQLSFDNERFRELVEILVTEGRA